MSSVVQLWVCELTLMQQSVLITAVRGPDGIRKNHVAKLLLRWYRRCVLLGAFESNVFPTPYSLGGGSFTGPSLECPSETDVWTFAELQDYWMDGMDGVVSEYLRCTDEMPHHFQLHLMHAAEILGYKHPVRLVRAWWHSTYRRLVNDMHLFPESEELMDKRLGDSEKSWREREEVTADGPGDLKGICRTHAPGDCDGTGPSCTQP